MKQRSQLHQGRGGILKTLLILLASLAVLGVAFLFFVFVFLKPGNMSKQEIYRGVYLTVQDVPENFGNGTVMIAEIHWDEPGVELYFRPFNPRGSGRMHFTLFPADYLRWDANLDIMINTTRYYPEEWYKCWPFKQVNTLETLVHGGEVSHIHQNSYMFGWNDQKEFIYEFTKPPSPEFLAQLETGIGVQSVSIHNGQIREAAMDTRTVYDARTFLAVDPVRKVMWLLVADNISELGINVLASRQGAIVGGQLDTQDASTMIIGSGARDVKALSGIRGRRMLAGTMGVRAETLSGN